jgi:hypothetical protein
MLELVAALFYFLERAISRAFDLDRQILFEPGLNYTGASFKWLLFFQPNRVASYSTNNRSTVRLLVVELPINFGT